MHINKYFCIPIVLLSIVSSSVAQINYPPQSDQFFLDFREAAPVAESGVFLHNMVAPEACSLEDWEAIIVDKVYGEVYYQTLKKDIPWMALCYAIGEEDAKGAKKMLVESHAVACSLPEYYIKSNWEKFVEEVGIKGEVKKSSAKGPTEHIAWDLLHQSLERKEFPYAQKLFLFLRNNYSLRALEILQRKGLSPPPGQLKEDIWAVLESGDFEEVKRVWKRAIWESTEAVIEATDGVETLPWDIVRLSMEHREIAYAKMFLIECYVNAKLPPNHYAHAKKFWDKLPQVGIEEKEPELDPLRGLARYVVWGLLVESLNHKEFTFAQELSKWLRDHYSNEVAEGEGSTSPFADEIAAVKKSKDLEQAKKLWDKIQVAKANEDKGLETTLQAIPWIILDISIVNKEGEYAKLMVKEACAVESTPKDYADAKKLWDKFLLEYNKEEFDDEIPPGGPEQYIGWRLFSESLDREDYKYAQKVFTWLDQNYPSFRSDSYPPIKQPNERNSDE